MDTGQHRRRLAQHLTDIGSVSACNRRQQYQAIPDQLLFPANTKHLYNICTMSAQRLRRWPIIVQMLYKYFVFTGLNAAPSKHEALNQCWFDAGSASQAVGQHWVNVVFAGSVDK